MQRFAPRPLVPAFFILHGLLVNGPRVIPENDVMLSRFEGRCPRRTEIQPQREESVCVSTVANRATINTMEDPPELLAGKERIIRRIEVCIGHNRKPVGYQETMAEESDEPGREETARLIRIASEVSARQNENEDHDEK